MKKLLLPIMFLSALALSGATVPAVATPVAAPAVVESVESVTADPSAILSVDTVQVATAPAPAPPAPVIPTPTAPAPAPADTVAPEAPEAVVETPTAPVPVPVAPEATEAPVESYPAPLPTVECLEDMPCWDCATMGNGICGNPVCAKANLFTVDVAGTCSSAPIGYTKDKVMEEGYSMSDSVGKAYAGSGSYSQALQRREGFVYVDSPTIPGVVHVFG